MEGDAEGLTPSASPSDPKDENSEWMASWLEELCPYYMALGVGVDEFWHGDYTNLRFYVDAHELYREQKNQEMYMQGLYNYQAFQAVIGMFSWGLGGKKGAKPEPYRDSPFAITEREKEAERQRAVAKTLAWVKQGQQGGV